MLLGLRDLQWRRKRFVIAVLAAGVVFALTILLSGVTAAFNNEARRTVDAFGADRWIVPAGSTSVFTSDRLMLAASADSLLSDPGVEAAAPLLALRSTIDRNGPVDVNVIGVSGDSFGTPEVSEGRFATGDDELVTTPGVGAAVGEEIELSGSRFTVVGHVDNLTYLAGTDTIVLPISRMQELFYAGQPLANAFAIRGSPSALPDGLAEIDNDAVRDSLIRPIKVASSSIAFIDVLLWFVAAGIIGSILYMTSLERVRDFAALKAIGARNSQVLSGLLIQAIILSTLAAAFAAVGAQILKPTFPMKAEIPLWSYPLTLGVAIVVGLLGSAAGMRRAVAADPALAFG